MTNVAHPQERRRYRRFPAATLKAQIKSKRGFFTHWQDVEVSDFNPYGIAINLHQEPELEQAFSLKLILEIDMGEITVEKIEATAKNKVLSNKVWRTGLLFDELKGGKAEETISKINRISQLLEKSVALNERLMGQQSH